MKKKFNVGIIGGGMIGLKHVECMQKDGRGVITHINARNEKKLKKNAEKYGIPNAVTDYKEVLADDKVDAVVIATPPNIRYEVLRDALAAGKHVLLEKPMALNPKELAKIKKLVKGRKTKVLECSCRHARLQPKFPAVKRLLESGKIGEVYHIDHKALTRRTFIEWNPAGEWSFYMDQAGGGPVMDQGVYDMSFHLGLFNDEPELKKMIKMAKAGLKLQNKYPDSDVEEHAAAFMEFSNGLTYSYERSSGTQLDYPNTTTIYGKDGVLQFGYNSWDPAEIIINTIGKKNWRESAAVKPVKMPKNHNDEQELAKHFFDYLQEKAEPSITLETAIKNLEICFKIIK